MCIFRFLGLAPTHKQAGSNKKGPPFGEPLKGPSWTPWGFLLLKRYFVRVNLCGVVVREFAQNDFCFAAVWKRQSIQNHVHAAPVFMRKAAANLDPFALLIVAKRTHLVGNPARFVAHAISFGSGPKSLRIQNTPAQSRCFFEFNLLHLKYCFAIFRAFLFGYISSSSRA